MGKCIIFCAGTLEGPVEPIMQEDLVIAADGGLRHIQALGLEPQLVLGDFDSLGYVPAQAAVFPEQKDDTDTMLAIKEGLTRGFREFVLYGGLGGSRLDHTVANFQALAYLARRGCRGTLMGSCRATAICDGGFWKAPADSRGVFSVFCLGSDARGVCIRGGQYPLEDGILTADFPLGVSNHFTGREATVSVEEGCLLILWQTDSEATKNTEF